MDDSGLGEVGQSVWATGRTRGGGIGRGLVVVRTGDERTRGRDRCKGRRSDIGEVRGMSWIVDIVGERRVWVRVDGDRLPGWSRGEQDVPA